MYKAYGDPGNGWTKFIDNKNNKVLRSSTFVDMPADLNGDELGIECEYGNYLFGDKLQDTNSMVRQFRDYRDCLTDAYAANVLMAIAEMNGGNVVDCELILSLPFGAMHLAKELMNRLTGEHKIKCLNYHRQTINITFPDNDYGIMPQNAAPAFVNLDLSNIKKEKEIWIAVANVGSMTFEQGTFGIDLESYKLLPGLKAQQATKTKGMYTLVNEIRPLLDKEFLDQLTDFSQHEMFEILISEKVWVGNQEIDVSEIVRPKKQEYIETVYNLCRGLWTQQNGRGILRMYQLTVAGGGAHIVAPYLREMNYHNNIVVSDDPQFDVVQGSKKWHELIGE